MKTSTRIIGEITKVYKMRKHELQDIYDALVEYIRWHMRLGDTTVIRIPYLGRICAAYPVMRYKFEKINPRGNVEDLIKKRTLYRKYRRCLISLQKQYNYSGRYGGHNNVPHMLLSYPKFNIYSIAKLQNRV